MPWMPAATRLQARLEDRRAFYDRWLTSWFALNCGRAIHIDLFNGSHAQSEGIEFSGTIQQVFWDAIARGLRREVVDQFAWVESEVLRYRPEVRDESIDQCAGQLISFADQIRRRTIDVERRLRGKHGKPAQPFDQGHWGGSGQADILAQARALKAAHSSPPSGAERVIIDMTATRDNAQAAKPYQVALSFAGEQRGYVEEVADALLAEGVAVFYDRHNSVALWGKDGLEEFVRLFSHDAGHVVMFISKEYVDKAWPREERRAALSRAMKTDEDYILPVRFDDSEVPGMPDTRQHLNAADYSPAQLAKAIIEKIGFAPLSGKASDLPPPSAANLSGEVSFDYSAHDGVFAIGAGEHLFETKWSKGSDTSIHVYNDPPSIHGVALADGAKNIADVQDASAFDFSSRSRMPNTGEVVVLRNKAGHFAALKILGIQDRTRGVERDELRFEYIILADGGKSFG